MWLTKTDSRYPPFTLKRLSGFARSALIRSSRVS